MTQLRRAAVAAIVLSMATSITSAADQQPLTPVPFTAVKFTDAFWAPRLETNRTVTVPHTFKMCEETGRIDNFAKAGGLMEGKFRGIFYDDSDVYKAIEGASYSLATHPDPDLDKYLDQVIAKIAAAQRPDGYLNTYYTIHDGLDKRYTRTWETHELYCAGHLFEAAVAHHRATGKDSLLNVAVKFADHLTTVFGPNARHDIPGHEEVELALVKLSNETHNPKYRDLAAFFLSVRGNLQGRDKLYGTHYQDHKPVLEQTTPTGHAVRQMYLLCGETDLASTHPEYVPVLDAMWHNLVDKRMYITGGIGARHDGEAFGDDYELPNATAYAETCAAIGNALWQSRMNLLHADGKYADTFERILYNGLLSGVSLGGDRFFYVNPLASAGNHHRKPWYGTACCPVNVVRFLPSLPGYQYATAAGAHGVPSLYVNLFAASDAAIDLPSTNTRPTRVRLGQETRYPWDGTVRLTVDPDPTTVFDVRIRLPEWAGRPTISIDGQPINDYRVENGYAVLDGTWHVSTVDIQFSVKPRRVYADPNVSADKGRVAIQYGPLVYCAEAADNPDVRLTGVFLPKDSPITTEVRPDILGGVTVLKTRAKLLSVDSKEPKEVDLTLIPYYAWDQRTPGAMAVWLAEDPSVATPVPIPTLANTSRASASHVNPTDTVDALSDAAPIAGSFDQSIPRFTWWDHRGSAEWVQYDFPKATTISSADVYFFDDTKQNGGCRLPKSWRLLYKDGDAWKPIEAKYPVAGDRFNSVKFAPVRTTALHLEAQLRPEFSGGILEWRVK